ncbi:MAG TPA: hypothetical protein VLJ21_02690, partial [Candidatus Binatia bacterium]|nr:hypothetical protein [Candidatus Binatia bacterium]
QILNQLGIRTVSDVLTFSEEQLFQFFGAFGQSLFWQSRGHGSAKLTEFWTAKSVGRQRTFEHDTRDPRQIEDLLASMIQSVEKQLKTEGLRFKTVTVKVRYEDFETKTKQKNLIDYVDTADAIKNIAREMLLSFLKDPRKIRLVGVSVHNLKPVEHAT